MSTVFISNDGANIDYDRTIPFQRVEKGMKQRPPCGRLPSKLNAEHGCRRICYDLPFHKC